MNSILASSSSFIALLVIISALVIGGVRFTNAMIFPDDFAADTITIENIYRPRDTLIMKQVVYNSPTTLTIRNCRFGYIDFYPNRVPTENVNIVIKNNTFNFFKMMAQALTGTSSLTIEGNNFVYEEGAFSFINGLPIATNCQMFIKHLHPRSPLVQIRIAYNKFHFDSPFGNGQDWENARILYMEIMPALLQNASVNLPITLDTLEFVDNEISIGQLYYDYVRVAINPAPGELPAARSSMNSWNVSGNVIYKLMTDRQAEIQDAIVSPTLSGPLEHHTVLLTLCSRPIDIKIAYYMQYNTLFQLNETDEQTLNVFSFGGSFMGNCPLIDVSFNRLHRPKLIINPAHYKSQLTRLGRIPEDRSALTYRFVLVHVQKNLPDDASLGVIRIHNNTAHLESNGRVDAILLACDGCRRVKEIHLTNNFVKSTTAPEFNVAGIRPPVENCDLVRLSHNSADLDIQTNPVFWGPRHLSVLEFHPVHVSRTTGNQFGVDGFKNVKLIEISHNSGRIWGNGRNWGFFTNTLYQNVQKFHLFDNHFNLSNRVPPFHLPINSGRVFRLSMSLLRVSDQFENFGELIFEDNTGTIDYDVASNVIAYGGGVGGDNSSFGMAAVILRRNWVIMKKFKYDGVGEQLSGIFSWSIVDPLANIKKLEFTNNYGVLESLEACPIAGCNAVVIVSASDWTNENSDTQIIIMNNDFTVKTANFSAVGINILTAQYDTPDEGFRTNPITGRMEVLLKTAGASMTGLGSIWIANNKITLHAPDFVCFVCFGVSGSLEAKSLLVENNDVVFLQSTATLKNRTTTSLYPVPLEANDDLDVLGWLESSYVSFGCPKGILYIFVPPFNGWFNGFFGCAEDSSIKMETVIIRNSRVRNFRTLFQSQSSLEISVSFEISNVDFASDFSSILNANPPPSTFTASNSHLLQVGAADGRLLVAEERTFSVNSFTIFNVKMSTKTRCDPLVPTTSLNIYSDRVSIGHFSSASKTSSILFDTVSANITCIIPSSSSSQQSPITVSMFSLDTPVKRLRSRNSQFRINSASSTTSQSSPSPTIRRGDFIATSSVESQSSYNAEDSSSFPLLDANYTTIMFDGLRTPDESVIAVTTAGNKADDAAFLMKMKCTSINNQMIIEAKDNAVKSSIGTGKIELCAGYFISKTETFSEVATDSQTRTESYNIHESETKSLTAELPVPDLGLSEETLQQFEDAALVSTAVATVIANNPGALLAAARGTAMMRLAMCRLAGQRTFNVPDPKGTMYNYSVERIQRPLKFPSETLIPDFGFGTEIGRSYRGAILINIIFLSLVTLATMYAATLNKQNWKEIVLETQHAIKKKSQEGGLLNGLEGADDPASEVDKMSFLSFWSIDRIMLKVLILMLPGWCKLAGGLTALAPGGTGDKIIGLAPIIIIAVFSLYCARYLFNAVSTVKGSDVKEQELDFSSLLKSSKKKRSVNNNNNTNTNNINTRSSSVTASGKSVPNNTRKSSSSRRSRRGAATNASSSSLSPSRSASSSIPSASAMNDTRSLVFASQNRAFTATHALGAAFLDPLLGEEEMSSSPGFLSSVSERDCYNQHKNNSRGENDDEYGSYSSFSSYSLILAAVRTTLNSGPIYFVEKSELYFPAGATSKTQGYLHRFLQHWFARFLLVGNHVWYNPYIDLKQNHIVPGPGLLTQFPYIFNTFWGPYKKLIPVENVKDTKRRMRRSAANDGKSTASGGSKSRLNNESSSSSSHSTIKNEKIVFESPFKKRIATVWIFISMLNTLIATSISGAGDVAPQDCYTSFFVSLFLTTLPQAIASLIVLPYLVPLRNTATIILEWAPAIGGLLFAYVLLDETTTLGEAQKTIAIAQTITTIPAATLGTAMSGFGLIRVGCLKLARSKIVTRTALREHLPVELEIAERRLLGKEPIVEKPKKNYFGIDTSWFFED